MFPLSQLVTADDCLPQVVTHQVGFTLAKHGWDGLPVLGNFPWVVMLSHIVCNSSHKNNKHEMFITNANY